MLRELKRSSLTRPGVSAANVFQGSLDPLGPRQGSWRCPHAVRPPCKERSAAVPVSVPIEWRVTRMFKKLSTLAAAAMACLTLAGCVSESGYSTYDRSYSRYDGPSYVYRGDRPRRDWDRRHHDRRDWNRHRDARRNNHRDRREWIRNERRIENWRGTADRSDRRDGRTGRDGRIWMQNN